jgi:hypothetical protein
MDHWGSNQPTDTNLPTPLSIINFNSWLNFGSVPSANEVFQVSGSEHDRDGLHTDFGPLMTIMIVIACIYQLFLLGWNI